MIASFVQEQGGFLSMDDLSAMRGEWVEPLSTTYRGHEVWELPPNTQGVTVLQMLNLLEPFDLAAMGFGSADHIHHLVEAKKLAFEDRARYFSDPEFANLPLAELISKVYAAERRKLMDPAQAAQVVEPGNPSLNGGDTVYLTVADSQGNMVSLIQSNFRGFGSGVCPPGLGFSLQNRGELFSLEADHPNAYAPGKRPFHTIIPAFVTRGGEPWLSFGVMGADMQPQAHVQVLVNLIDFGMNLQEAGDAPRILHEGSSTPTGKPADGSGTVYLEPGFAEDIQSELARRGHRLGEGSFSAFGGYQAILRDAVNGTWIGASESRKDGQAAGY